MDLKNINLKVAYDSDESSILRDFYIPALSNSIKYDRIAGYFCSNSLAIASKGISNFIRNNGKMRLIANVFLSIEDQDSIKKALKDAEDNVMEEIYNLEDGLKKDHIKMLGWMVKQNLIEIKIAVLTKGIEHKKLGILEDINRNIISFTGSDNETYKGWIDNDESFHVFRSWLSKDDALHLEADIKMFNKLWNDDGRKVKVYPVSEAFSRGLIKIAPRDNDEFRTIEKEITEKLLKYEKVKEKNFIKIELRDYQKIAIENWKNNNWKGILEMATASGKTYTALKGSEELYLEKGKLAVLILVPSKQLVEQWSNILNSNSKNVISISSKHKTWEKSIESYIYLFNRNKIDNLFIVSTILSFLSKLTKYIEKIPKKDILLIADEAHYLGAYSTRNKLIDNNFSYTLGLTATPVRYFDDKGTDFLYNYLGKSVYEFSLKNGQDMGFLCKYKYHTIFCDLSTSELEKYKKLTKAITLNYFEDEETLTILLNKRSKLLKDAKSKFNAFNQLVSNLKNEIEYSIVYTDENQIEKICSILKNNDITFGVFLGKTPDKEREELISKLFSGIIKTIVAIRCFNEGVDIPPLKMGFFLSNSGNPKEFIQRRGRLLRTYEGKGMVDMYDFIALPNSDVFDLSVSEKKINNQIIKKELSRVKEFNDIALNKYENELKILNRLSLVMGDLDVT